MSLNPFNPEAYAQQLIVQEIIVLTGADLEMRLQLQKMSCEELRQMREHLFAELDTKYED